MTEGGRATGVEVAGGKRFEARAVVSTLNPEQTFRQLVGDAACPTDLRRSVQSWEWEERTMFGLHLGIRGEIAFRCAEPRLRDAMIVFCGLDTDQELLAHLHRIDAGEAGKCEWLHMTIPSLFDATMAPAGHHILRAEAVVKYDASWSTGARAFGDSCLELIQRHVTLGEIVLRREHTPLDIESKLATMKRGSIKHGAYTSLQMGYLRPNLLCSQSETPIGGLFLGGASMYPGGMIIGGPGYIAANVVGAFLAKE